MFSTSINAATATSCSRFRIHSFLVQLQAGPATNAPRFADDFSNNYNVLRINHHPICYSQFPNSEYMQAATISQPTESIS
jgi:hypothetical protein